MTVGLPDSRNLAGIRVVIAWEDGRVYSSCLCIQLWLSLILVSLKGQAAIRKQLGLHVNMC